jgi:glycine reductase
VYLASATKDLPPDHVETFAPPGDVTGLPRFLYMYQVQRPRYYGQVLPRAGAMTAAQHLPLFVNPAEVLDGALVAMSSIGASFREYTYLMQNNPVIKEMYRRHGATIDFRGVLLCSNGDDPRSKQTVATASAGIARYVEADGVVLNHLGGGHAMVDVMRTCKELESLGIRTVLMLTEMSSTPGESGFIDYVTEADAIVSTGNFEEAVALKPVEKVYGGTHMMESGDDAAGPLNITVRHILAATSTAGAGTLSGADL